MLIRKDIHRQWLLPQPRWSERLQELVTHHVLMNAVDALEGLTASWPAMVHTITDALYGERLDGMEDDNLGTFRSGEVEVTNQFRGLFYPPAVSRASDAIHVLVELVYYNAAHSIDDPQTIYFVVVYWDKEAYLWRLANEQWPLESAHPGNPAVDHRAPAVITAFSPTEGSTPSLEDVLAMYVGR